MSINSNQGFYEEFDRLAIVGKDQPTTAGNLTCNRPKNRYEVLLPYDYSRFVLQPLDNETKSCSDYIHANYIPVNHPS